MIHIVFVVLVVLGFIFRMTAEVASATINARSANAIAWGCWTIAAIVWAFT